MRVVINACFGGFSLSPEATILLWQRGAKGIEATHVDEYWPVAEREEYNRKYKTLGYDHAIAGWREYQAKTKEEKDAGRNLFLTIFSPDEQFVLNSRQIERNDPELLKVIEEMGAEEASGGCAELKVVEIPDGVDYEICEYDGNEHIAEKHRTWS